MLRFKSAYLEFLLVCCCGLSVLLPACGSDNPPTAQPAAAPTRGVPPTLTPAPPKSTAPVSPVATTVTASGPVSLVPLPSERQPATTAAPPPGSESTCQFVAEYVSAPLSRQVKESDDIVQAQVTNIGPMVWNTADGKEPVAICGPDYYQYSPVEITVRESYKGQMAAGTKLTLWLNGAPGSLKKGNYDYFPKAGEFLVFFLGQDWDLRSDTPANPLTTRLVWQRYRQLTPGVDKWVSQITETPFTLVWLKALIKDPSIEPTPTPFPPTATPYAQAGQTIQPAKLYGLNKATRIYLKAAQLNPPLVGDELPGSDRFNRLVKAFDQPLKVLENLTTYPDDQTGLAFGFELPDNSYASFAYYPKSGTLVHQLKDNYNMVLLAAPPELKAIFGL